MIERGSASKVRLCNVIKEYNKCEEQRNKLAKVSKAAEERSAKLEVEKTKLLNQLEVQQVDLTSSKPSYKRW